MWRIRSGRACAVTLGAVGIVAQTALLRELLPQFAGNELYVGLIIAIWIAAESLGAYVAGLCKTVRIHPVAAFIKLTGLFSLLFPVFIFLTRSFKIIASIPTDQGLTLVQIFVPALLLILPLALLHGGQFVAACALFREMTNDEASSSGRVYALDTAGTIAGGALASFLLLPFLTPFQTAVLILLAGGGASLWLWKATPHVIQRGSLFWPLTMLVSATLLLSGGAGYLERASLALQWQGKELVYSKNSPYQSIAVLRNQEQHTIYADGVPLLSLPDPDIGALELFVHLPLLSHPAPKRVLLLGGGGGALAEILKHPTVIQIDYLEMDLAILESVRLFADPLTLKALSDSRVRVLHRDGRQYLRDSRERYDAIMIGAPLPETLQGNRLFSEEFFRQLLPNLSEDGIVALLSPGSTAYYGQEMKRVTESLLATFNAVFQHTLVIPGELNLFMASTGSALEQLGAGELVKRLQTSGVKPRLITAEHLGWLFDPTQRDWFNSNIKAQGVVNRDLAPYLFSRQIMQATIQFNPALKPLLEQLGRLTTKALLPYVALMVILAIVISRYFSGFAVPCLIVSSGFVSMLVELALFLLFQLFHGAMIQTVGLLIALFMLGIWCGSLITSNQRMSKRGDRHWLLAGESGFILLTGGLMLLFSVNGITTLLPPMAAYFLILPLLFLTGFLTGLQFPPAVRLCSNEQKSGAALVYSVDLLGGCLGGFLGSLLLLPLLGFRDALLLMLLLKVGSFFVLQNSSIGGRIERI